MNKQTKKTLKNVGACLGLAAWGFFGLIVAQLVMYLVFSIFQANFDLPFVMVIYEAVVYIVAFLIIALAPGMVMKKWKTGREELGLKGAPTWKDIGLAVAAFVLYLILSSLLIMIFRTVFSWFDAEQAQDVGFNNIIGMQDLLMAFIALVVVAPVAEELIFRGWLYGKMRKRVAMPVAMILVSLLFGLMHGQWNVAVDVFVMSMIMCFQRELTGTVYSGILLHMIKNGLAFYLLYISTGG